MGNPINGNNKIRRRIDRYIWHPFTIQYRISKRYTTKPYQSFNACLPPFQNYELFTYHLLARKHILMQASVTLYYPPNITASSSKPRSNSQQILQIQPEEISFTQRAAVSLLTSHAGRHPSLVSLASGASPPSPHVPT